MRFEDYWFLVIILVFITVALWSAHRDESRDFWGVRFIKEIVGEMDKVRALDVLFVQIIITLMFFLYHSNKRAYEAERWIERFEVIEGVSYDYESSHELIKFSIESRCEAVSSLGSVRNKDLDYWKSSCEFAKELSSGKGFSGEGRSKVSIQEAMINELQEEMSRNGFIIYKTKEMEIKERMKKMKEIEDYYRSLK